MLGAFYPYLDVFLVESWDLGFSTNCVRDRRGWGGGFVEDFASDLVPKLLANCGKLLFGERKT